MEKRPISFAYREAWFVTDPTVVSYGGHGSLRRTKFGARRNKHPLVSLQDSFDTCHYYPQHAAAVSSVDRNLLFSPSDSDFEPAFQK